MGEGQKSGSSVFFFFLAIEIVQILCWRLVFFIAALRAVDDTKTDFRKIMLQFCSERSIKKPCLKVQNLQYEFLA